MEESRKYMEGKMKKRILIVGLGLIGSSLALCIKKGIQTVRLSVSIIKRRQLNLLRKRV